LNDRSIHTCSSEASWEVTIWRFIEGLCHESEANASSDVERALKLADLALRAAERAPGKGERRQKIESYAWSFIGNARRVSGKLPGAAAALARAGELRTGTPGPLGNAAKQPKRATLPSFGAEEILLGSYLFLVAEQGRVGSSYKE